MSITPLLLAILLQASTAVTPSAPTVSGPAIPTATLDDKLEITGESLAARQIKSRMFVQVGVNGSGPYRFLVDSGADRSVIGLTLSKQLALPPGDPVLLQSIAGPSRVDTVILDHLKIGNSVIPGIEAPALPEAYLGAQGLLGIDALAEQRLMLDFDRKTVTIQDARTPVMTLPDEIVITARRRNGQLILTQAAVNATRILAVIDTGSEVTIGNSALQERIFRNRKTPPATTVVTMISVTGQTVSANAAVLPEVRLGGVTLRNVPVVFADLPPFKLFGLEKEPAMLLGSDVLEIFRRVSLDFRNRKVRFVMRRPPGQAMGVTLTPDTRGRTR